MDIYYQDEGDLSEIDNQDAMLSDYFTYADNNSYISLKTRGSYTYNNFAYAFYMYWGGDIKCLITDINPFIEDKSFIEVSSPQPEDIIVYRTNNKPIHAGIIKSVLYKPANKDIGSNVIVESKWYPNGVFEHRGDLCPYMPNHHLLAGEPADNVVYYRRHEAHNFKVVAGSNNSSTHTAQCECGETKEESHKYNHYRMITGFKEGIMHEAYCVCGATKAERHTLATINIGTEPYTYCTKCKWSKLEAVIRPEKKEWEI